MSVPSTRSLINEFQSTSLLQEPAGHIERVTVRVTVDFFHDGIRSVDHADGKIVRMQLAIYLVLGTGTTHHASHQTLAVLCCACSTRCPQNDSKTFTADTDTMPVSLVSRPMHPVKADG